MCSYQPATHTHTQSSVTILHKGEPLALKLRRVRGLDGSPMLHVNCALNPLNIPEYQTLWDYRIISSLNINTRQKYQSYPAAGSVSLTFSVFLTLAHIFSFVGFFLRKFTRKIHRVRLEVCISTKIQQETTNPCEAYTFQIQQMDMKLSGPINK